MCERERERERERVCVRESVCVCVRDGDRECKRGVSEGVHASVCM